MIELPIITHEYIMIGKGDINNIDVSIAEYLFESMKNNPTHCMIESETGRSISNSVLLKHIVALATSLKSRGIKPGDVIGLCSENRLEYAVPILAVLSLGATVVTLNPLYTIEELTHVLSIAKPSIIFCSPYTANKHKEIQTRFSFIKEIVFFDTDFSCDGFTRYTDLLSKKVDVNSYRCAAINPRESVAVILCSSGTTGLPKCVELTHSNILCFFNVVRNASWFRDGIQVVTLGLVPFFHGYGFGILLASLAFDIKLIIMSKFDEEVFLSTIEKYRVSMLCVVSPLVVFLAKHPLVSKYDLSSLDDVICGAAPLSKEVQLAAQKRLKLPKYIRQGYGMTELSISTTIVPEGKLKLGSVGVVVPRVECKVVDTDTGKALPPFREGEICFRGPYVMKGYRNNPVATAEAVDSDQWLHTGDIGYYDQEGFLFIVDRLKELIKYKGFQVAPAELEAILLTNPKIKDAAVIGFPNEEAGELPMAFVVKQSGVDITAAEIKSFVAGRVSPQKRLHIIKFVEDIPKNSSGKILRRELRAMINKSKL